MLYSRTSIKRPLSKVPNYYFVSKVLYSIPLFNGQPLLSGQFSKSPGWPLNRGPTVLCLSSIKLLYRKKTVISKTKAHFARFGIPLICHTDNGPQFASKDYMDFASQYWFTHTTSIPYHSQVDGRAEAAVKVSEAMLKKSDDFQIVLLNYRNTPPKGHTYSPAQRIVSRRTRTSLPTPDHLLEPMSINRDQGQTQRQVTVSNSGPDLDTPPPPPLHHNKKQAHLTWAQVSRLLTHPRIRSGITIPT